MPKHETKNRFYTTTWEVDSLVMTFGQFKCYYKKKFFIKKLYKHMAWRLVPDPF